jgi:hypothetical protein
MTMYLDINTAVEQIKLKSYSHNCLCTDKKEKKIFLIYKEIEMGSVAKSYVRNGFLIYSMRKCANDPF